MVLVYLPTKLGWLFPIYGKKKHVPNHQPDLCLPDARHSRRRCQGPSLTLYEVLGLFDTVAATGGSRSWQKDGKRYNP